ncbi:Ribonuclease HII [uncultured Eubacterium sp.]|nr:Ribonuclease HII [uncultured Eubacterium sp.]
MKKAEREIFLKNRLEELKTIENQLRAEGFQYIAGVDEVGRGPLAGPVVAAAVVLPEEFDVLGVDDSKKLSEKKRNELFDQIIEQAICYGIGQKDHQVIDDVNILEATKLAMAEAIEAAEKMLQDKLGKEIDFVLFDAMKIEAVEKPQQSLIKGDSKSISIAAASIVAKVTRDRQMIDYHQQYPHYGFDSNKGYGTKTHYEGIEEHGITPIHRKSFLKNIIRDK